MDSLWSAIGRRRDDVIARGSAFVRDSGFVRRTRAASAEILARAEQRASELQGSLSSRRSGLDGKPLQRIERRLLLRLEDVLQRVGQGLRRVQRLSPGRGRIAIEPDAAPQPEDATLVDELDISSGAMPRALESAAPPVTSSPARAPAARATGKKRIRVTVGAAASPAAVEAPSPKRAPARAPKPERPAARRVAKPGAKAPKVAAQKPRRDANGSAAHSGAKASTRWVARPADVDVEALGKLPAKALVSRIRALDEASRRALLAHEKQNKKRKSVVDALAARLPS